MLYLTMVIGLQAGCRKENAPATQAEDTAKLQTILAKADAVDGAVDHTIAKCAGCALLMGGSPKYAAKAHGYELHFCSDYCRKAFEEAPSESILALKIPTP